MLNLIFPFLVACLPFLSPDIARAAEPVSKPGLSLSLTLGSADFTLGEPILVTVLLSNPSSQDYEIPSLWIPEFHALKFRIQDEKGIAVPYSGAVLRLSSAVKETQKLRPGYIYGKVFNLVPLYGLKAKHVYTIEAELSGDTPAFGPLVKAQKLSLSIR